MALWGLGEGEQLLGDTPIVVLPTLPALVESVLLSVNGEAQALVDDGWVLERADWPAGGTMEVEQAIVEAHAGTTMFLKGGNAVYRVGDDEITVGPGHCAHTMWKMHNSPGAPESFRLLVSLLSPVDHTLRLQTGKFQA